MSSGAAVSIRSRAHINLVRGHPEWLAAAVVAAAWILLVAFEFGASGGHRSPRDSLRIEDLAWWSLMTVAMMGPTALIAVRHTAANSLSWRRSRAIVEFASTYLAVWICFGAVVLGLRSGLGIMPGTANLALALTIAAVWELTPAKQRWLRLCHRSIPLPPKGWPAEKAALEFGLVNGLACVGSCSLVMVIMAVTPTAHLWWSIALTGLVMSERMLDRPQHSARRNAFVLAVAAAIMAIVALAR